MYFAFLKALLDSSDSIGNKIQNLPIWVVRLLILLYGNHYLPAWDTQDPQNSRNERLKLEFREEGIAHLPWPTYFY